MRLTRQSKTDLLGLAFGPPLNRCRAGSAQSSLSTTPSAPVAVSLADQFVTAVRSPSLRDARHVQREVESTRSFHVIRCLAATAPIRSCTFATIARVAAPHPGRLGQDRGHGTSEGIAKSARRGREVILRHPPLLLERLASPKLAG